jgi:signal transduction histidine kinase
MENKAEVVPVRVRSHVLRLLGDQLVGHDRLAIFELVKNSYDADATNVFVRVDLAQQKISVRDNGQGMTVEVVRDLWLDIGTDSKRGSHRVRSPRFGRMPLGEKGVGRLAVQKLGSKIHMVTRSKDAPEVCVDVAWNELIESSNYVDGNLVVNVVQRAIPKDFPDETTGTLIEISDLARKHWTRGDLRDLKRLVVSLASPFESNDSFDVVLEVPGRENDINDVPDLSELLKRSVWTYEFQISEMGFHWSYSFTPPRIKDLQKRQLTSEGGALLEWCDEARKEAKANAQSAADVPLFVNLSQDLSGIGPIRGRFHVFYRRDEVLRMIGDPRQTKQWLKDQAGVRVFRDGMRVYNYGEPNDDWLGLNARRINRPTAKLGTDQTVAAISLDLAKSDGLREKTNREGFNQDETFARFRLIILSVVEQFEKLHDTDRRALDLAIKSDDSQVGSTIRLRDAITGLKNICSHDKELGKTLKPYVSAIEHEVEQVQSVMLSAGMAGMGLALVFHEIDRSIRTLTALAEKGMSPERLRDGLADLRKMLDSISVLMRQGKSRKLSIREVVRQALELNETRFAFHNVSVSAPVITGEEPDFFITAPQHLVLSAVNNIIDNAIYWTGHRYQEKKELGHRPAIRVSTAWSEQNGGVLSVIDNGAGFSISAADAMQPFITKRTGGMGLGLYYCRLVMENIGGGLELGTAEDAKDYFNVPLAYNGAAVTMLFKATKENE